MQLLNPSSFACALVKSPGDICANVELAKRTTIVMRMNINPFNFEPEIVFTLIIISITVDNITY